MQTSSSAAVRGEGVGSAKPVLGKRQADDSRLNDDDRFAKRLNLLSLRDPAAIGSSTYYIPVSPESAAPSANGHVNAPSRRRSERLRVSRHDDDEHMQLDDTRDRVYIHNLDDELSDIESDEEKLIFLPEIERHFSKIPQHILNPQRDDDYENHELILYGVPKSLTMDVGHDSVRKAIIESRQRAADKAAEEARMEDMSRRYEQGDQQESVETAHGYGGEYVPSEEPDPDDMDLG